ncbi:ccr4 associated factor [Dispira simplex]|nr:ccr4 associated factor [Dispira simplex]
MLSWSTTIIRASLLPGRGFIPFPCRRPAHPLGYRVQRYQSTVSAPITLASLTGSDRYCRLTNRGLVQVSGAEASQFLQGLITNHMPQIAVGGSGFYAAFLIPQGRMLYDVMVYPKNQGERFPDPPTFFVECDANVTKELCKYMTLRKLRSKVNITDVSSEHHSWNIWGPGVEKLWCWQQLCNPQQATGSAHPRINKVAAHLPRGSLILKNHELGIWLTDHRVSGMGLRTVLPTSQVPALPTSFREVASLEYTLRRLLLGIPEGIEEIPSRQALPLEYNLDYMHGVDFRKGCYVGQELTIRTYHTGVVRKRVVPVTLVPDQSGPLPEITTPVVDMSPSFVSPTAATDIFRVPIEQSPEDTLVQLAPRLNPDETTNAGNGAASTSRRGTRPAARYCSGLLNIGLAVVRLEHIGSPTHKLVLAIPDAQGQHQLLRVLPRVPQWWPSTP